MPQSRGPNQPWFLGAPLTKLMVYSTILVYIILESQDGHGALSVDSTNTAELYRYFTGTITFASAGDLILGTFLLYTLSKRFEREMGTRKFAIFLLGVAFFAASFQLILSQLFGGVFKFQYSGPYPTLGALLMLFHIYTPRLHPRFFGVLGFHFSEKSIGYLLPAQVAFHRGVLTLTPTVCGMIAGYFMVTIPPLNGWDIPDGLARILTRLAQRFVEDPPAPTIVGGGGAGGGFRNNAPFEAAPAAGMPRRAPPPLQPQFQQLPPPSESTIEQLTNMGFERDAVVRALRASHNNVERAADRLLTGS